MSHANKNSKRSNRRYYKRGGATESFPEELKTDIPDYEIDGFVAKGGEASIFKATHKDGTKYIVRVVDLNNVPEKEFLNKLLIKKHIKNKISVQDCESGKCYIACLNKNLVCSSFLEKSKKGQYILEIMPLYDSDLKTFIENNKGFWMGGFTTTEKVENFVMSSESLKAGVSFLHKNGMAHGDIKPENILVKLTENKTSITDLALTDFDTMCFEEQCKETGISYEFSTMRLVSSAEEYNIEIKQISDIYATSLTILLMWFGYERFYSILEDIFETSFKPLTQLQNLQMYQIRPGRYTRNDEKIDKLKNVLLSKVVTDNPEASNILRTSIMNITNIIRGEDIFSEKRENVLQKFKRKIIP